MRRLEVFFDYECPYCLRGHELLKELLPSHPDVEPVWRPCEAHPRPEQHGLHSDLCIQGMLFASEQNADIWEYHERMYKAAVKDRANIEDIDVLVTYVQGLLDPAAFRDALENGRYAEEQRLGNGYAYQQNEVWFVPSFRMDGKKLDAAGGIGVTKEQLDQFMAIEYL